MLKKQEGVLTLQAELQQGAWCAPEYKERTFSLFKTILVYVIHSIHLLYPLNPG